MFAAPICVPNHASTRRQQQIVSVSIICPQNFALDGHVMFFVYALTVEKSHHMWVLTTYT